MRQMVISRYGGPDVLEIRDAADPEPGSDEVRIRVRAAGVNFADVMGRMGLYPDAPPAPYVPGYEVAGVVDAIGRDVTRVHRGDRVVALTRFGGYADTVIVPADVAFHAPDRPFAELAALPVAYLTALVALYQMANVQPSETVLVLGVSGGVGLAATSLARLRRAVVIGTASAAKHDELHRLGVDHAIDHRADLRAEVLRLTGGRGVDVVMDSVGGRSYAQSYRLLAPLGRLVMLGMTSLVPGRRRNWLAVLQALWSMPRFKPLSLINRNRGVFGLNLAHLWTERRRLAAAMEMLTSEMAAGRIAPVVAATFPLARAADAHRFVHDRKNVGKVVLTI
ncbi:MAG: medium chain dehydrogenase/reductase family protein [Acidobacteriota bacterium]